MADNKNLHQPKEGYYETPEAINNNSNSLENLHGNNAIERRPSRFDLDEYY